MRPADALSKLWPSVVVAVGIGAGVATSLQLPARVSALERGAAERAAAAARSDSIFEAHLVSERGWHDDVAAGVEALRLGECSKETNLRARAYLRCSALGITPPSPRP